MSKLKIQSPVIHTPGFEEYQTTGSNLKANLGVLGLEVPLGMLDSIYYYTNLGGWGKILKDLVFKSSLYKKDKFDCENYALKAMSLCHERYGLNTMGMVIGDTPLGRHGWNIFYHGDGFMLWEPNEGFPAKIKDFSGSAFEIGEYGYKPDLILI